MKSVDDVIRIVYGSNAEAAQGLDVGRSALSNWRAWGYFPSAVAIRIATQAVAKGILLPITEIPVQVKQNAVVGT